MMPVLRGYFDRAVRHHLQLGLAAGASPPAGLLQVAETIGGAQWQPELLEWRKALAAMLGELPAVTLQPHSVSAVLRTSAAWADFDSIVESWFEDDQDVARLVSGPQGCVGAHHRRERGTRAHSRLRPRRRRRHPRRRADCQDIGAMNERIAQAEQLLDHFGHEIVHCRQVRDLALNLFDQLQELHRLGPDDGEIDRGIGPERQCACRPQEGLRPAQPTGERAGIFRPACLEKIEGRADRGCAWGVSGLLVIAASQASGVRTDGYNLSHRKKRHFNHA